MIADGARQLTHSNGTAVYLMEGICCAWPYSVTPRSDSPARLYVGYTLPLKQSLGRFAFETGKPLLIEDVQNEPRLYADLRRRIVSIPTWVSR